jgi:hypothetical protein
VFLFFLSPLSPLAAPAFFGFRVSSLEAVFFDNTIFVLFDLFVLFVILIYSEKRVLIPEKRVLIPEKRVLIPEKRVLIL